MWSSRLYLQLKQLQILARKKCSGRQRDSVEFKDFALQRCGALPSELWRLRCLEQTNLSSSSLPVTGLNETWNEVDLNCGNTDKIEMWLTQLYLEFKQLRILGRKKFSGNGIRIEGLCIAL